MIWRYSDSIQIFESFFRHCKFFCVELLALCSLQAFVSDTYYFKLQIQDKSGNLARESWEINYFPFRHVLFFQSFIFITLLEGVKMQLQLFPDQFSDVDFQWHRKLSGWPSYVSFLLSDNKTSSVNKNGGWLLVFVVPFSSAHFNVCGDNRCSIRTIKRGLLEVNQQIRVEILWRVHLPSRWTLQL